MKASVGWAVFTVLLSGCGSASTGPSPSTAEKQAGVGCTQVLRDAADRVSGSWVTETARVTRLLPDAHGKYTHQRLILRCASGLTTLVVNDVTFGSRVPARVGDVLTVRGIYIWNSLGGLIHYTHHSDTGGPGGWLLLHRHVYAWIPFRTNSWKSACAGVRHVDGEGEICGASELA